MRRAGLVRGGQRSRNRVFGGTYLRSPSVYDSVAPSFDHHRPLPEHVPPAIRAAILDALNTALRPRLLDVGGGTGRIGRAFVAANDDYVAVDLSLGMLDEFARWCDRAGYRPALLQADGQRLPFRDDAFDAALLIQVVGAAEGWRALVKKRDACCGPQAPWLSDAPWPPSWGSMLK